MYKRQTFTSSDETIATVNQQGKVVAVNGGTAVITAALSLIHIYVSPGVKPSKVTDGVETICVSE